MRYYSEDHIWVCLDDGVATLGISRHAAAELGELTFVELPRPGTRLARGDVLCVVESVKTAADLCTPTGGTVCAANLRLQDYPGLVSVSPEDEGWLCRLAGVAPVEVADLMNESQYLAYLGSPPPPP